MNTVITIQIKLKLMEKVHYYQEILKQSNQKSFYQKNNGQQKIMPYQIFDNHFRSLTIFFKLQSFYLHFILDLCFGIFTFFILVNYTSEILEILHYFGQGLHIDVLTRQIQWLMGLPAGFKPNPNLDNFLGNFILDLIMIWNHTTTFLTMIESFVVKAIAGSGFMGLTFFLSACHDVLFFCSTYIFVLYTLLAALYKYLIEMLGTLMLLFRGKKYNTLRQRVEGNSF